MKVFSAEEKSGDEIVADSIYIYIYIMDVRDPHEETGSQTCGGLASLASLGRMPDWWHRLS